MSSLVRARLRARLTIAAAALASLLGVAVFSSPADAAFTTGTCLGDTTSGRGASFMASAQQQVFIPFWANTYCANLGVGVAPGVTYDSTGSGSGRRSFGARTNGTPEGDNATGSISRSIPNRYAGTDEPLNAQQQADINKGTDAIGDEGLVRTIPVATGAVAVAVNVPDGCTVWAKPGTATPFTEGSGDTGFTAADKLKISDWGNANNARLQITRDEVEKIYNGGTEYDTWGELVPWINDGNGTAGQAGDTRCQAFPLIHVRRFDDSGTSYAFKDYLDKLNPSRGWLTTYNTPDTRTWPNTTRSVAFDYNNDGDLGDVVPNCGAQYAPWTTTYPATGPLDTPANAAAGTYCLETQVPLLQTTSVAAVGSAANGNGPLVDHTSDRDGAVGYGDLSTVRQRKSNTFERQDGAAEDKYWVKVQAKNLTSYADPQSAPSGFKPNGGRGSNCSGAILSNLPTGNDPTTGNWAAVSSADSTLTGYGSCTLTYVLAWDDYSGPYSASPDGQAAEERKARTVKDFLTAAVSQEGQAGLAGFDYSPLSGTIRQLAADAVAKIGWQKTTGTGGGGGGTTPPPPGGGTPPPPGGTTPIVTPVSNAFTFSKPRASKGNLLFSVQVPGAGNVRIKATAKVKGKTITVASGASSRSSGGTVKLTLKPGGAAKAALRKNSLKVSISITFTPTGGQAKTTKTSLTLKRTAAKKVTKKK